MTYDSLLGISVLFMFIAGLVYLVFGQVTVRKLRKNPETRNKLGLVLASGWDILNVVGPLSRPLWLSTRLRRSRLNFTAADERPIYAHANRFDWLIARLFFYIWIGSVVAFLSIGTIASFGFID